MGLPKYIRVNSFTEYETETLQCLTCKDYLYINGMSPRFCVNCGIEFEGEFTKKNPRYPYQTKFSPKLIKIVIHTYHRKDISKVSDYGFSIEGPVTETRLAHTKDKDNYYRWEEDYCPIYLSPFFPHLASQRALKAINDSVRYRLKQNKTIRVVAILPNGTEKILKEVQGEDRPYEPGYGAIACSGAIIPDKNYNIGGIFVTGEALLDMKRWNF